MEAGPPNICVKYINILNLIEYVEKRGDKKIRNKFKEEKENKSNEDSTTKTKALEE
ncbi:MAG: hypothetical protein ACTSW1_12155 [Candidatus Hodarchaeales archaeon]